MEGFAPAVFASRKAGEHRTAVLQAGDENRPSLAVKFITPDFLLISKAEASAARALASVRDSADLISAYGFDERTFTDDELLGLARLIASVETAAELWVDWNFAELDEAGQPQILPLTRANIVRLLEDQQIRLVWNAHLEAASPLERDEGNVSAASPNGNTAEAATTADSASSETPPAAAASEAPVESAAPALNTNP